MQETQAKCADCGATVRTSELGAQALETPFAAAMLSNSFAMPAMCPKCANYNLTAA
jgi:hypothetical protein